jgi:hypothetical protein
MNAVAATSPRPAPPTAIRRAGSPSDQVHAQRHERPPTRPVVSAMPAHGSTSAASWTTPPAVAATFSAAATRSHCTPSESYAVANARGACRIIAAKANSSTGTTVSTYDVTTRRTQGLSSVTFSSGSRPGSTLLSTGLIRVSMSGTPVRSLRM